MSPPSSHPHTPSIARSTQQAVHVHLPRLHAVGRRLLGCDHLADDAVQESLVALWREPSSPTNPGAWLMRAVVHRCRHIRRMARRRRHHEHLASEHCERHRGCDNPLHIAIAHETDESLASALNDLPDEQREALYLYGRTSLDYKGIAARLALPIGTVRSRLARARTTVSMALRRHLTPE